jgi:hypothetical protein
MGFPTGLQEERNNEQQHFPTSMDYIITSFHGGKVKAKGSISSPLSLRPSLA